MKKEIVKILFFSVFFLLACHVTAATLPSGGSVSGYLTAGSTDLHSFSGNSGETITLIMDETVSSYGQIVLYKPDGSYWTYGNNALHVTLPGTGTYSVVVKFSSTAQYGNYQLHYQRGGDSVENGSLASGSVHTGHLDTWDMDSYTFSAAAGETATLILDEAVSSYGQMYVYRPDGSYWTYGNNALHITLPVTGIYTVVVRYSALAQNGDYSLHYVLGGDVVENGELLSAHSYSDSLTSYDMDSYRFDGVTGETITLTLDENVSSYGQIYLYKPDGSYWTYGNNALHVTLPETGTYTLVVRFSALTQNGDYLLRFYRGGQAVEKGSLISGTNHSATLAIYDFDSYTFSGNAGETITLLMDETVSSYGQIFLYKPDGSYWTYGNNALHVTLPETGIYSVVVRYSALTQNGDYTLRYMRGGDSVDSGSLTSGATHTGSLSTYDLDSYTFSGNAGETITLIMNESVSSYGQIFLYKPDGSYWTYGNNAVHVTLPVSGSYTVAIRFSSLVQYGNYELHYVRGGDAVEKGSISSGQTRSATLDTYDMDSYTFSGIGGFTASLSMSESVSSYGQIFLYKPDGSYWTYGNNSKLVTLPVSGTYTVVVRFSSLAQQGPYSLSLGLTP
ncbi:hypothetical protein [Teredinibacter sp. KSP-S5-2]|uniref:hypothetical protein n=1 Tax=Teredinibacter sp. KSP-S5-2 TaxID=3034506 RepID=UPI002934EC03|nr:hypothetical protein [Teredinibacter sp. KSP-S5-2]WNO10003.1 hypothetical protein P5V12_02340 [Teredinibacter sp. KSP-S5-2]